MRSSLFKQTAELNDAYEKLKHAHVNVARLHSEQRQVEREQALRQLRKREVALLLTTDVAARGLDIPGLPAVVNYDLPKNVNTYIHRVGRTGRMGADGTVINIGNERDLRMFKQLVKEKGYELEPVYLYQRQLVTDQNELAELKKQAPSRPVRKKPNKPVTQAESAKKKRKKKP